MGADTPPRLCFAEPPLERGRGDAVHFSRSRFALAAQGQRQETVSSDCDGLACGQSSPTYRPERRWT